MIFFEAFHISYFTNFIKTSFSLSHHLVFKSFLQYLYSSRHKITHVYSIKWPSKEMEGGCGTRLVGRGDGDKDEDEGEDEDEQRIRGWCEGEKERE